MLPYRQYFTTYMLVVHVLSIFYSSDIISNLKRTLKIPSAVRCLVERSYTNQVLEEVTSHPRYHPNGPPLSSSTGHPNKCPGHLLGRLRYAKSQ